MNEISFFEYLHMTNNVWPFFALGGIAAVSMLVGSVCELILCIKKGAKA